MITNTANVARAMERRRDVDDVKREAPSSQPTSPKRKASVFEPTFLRKSEEENEPTRDGEYTEGWVEKIDGLGNIVRVAQRVRDNRIFKDMMISVIVVAGITVGLQTYDSLSEMRAVIVLDSIVLGFFITELLIKVVAKLEQPAHVFTKQDGLWNSFDLVIITMSLPLFDWGTSGGLVRLLRLLRLVKLVRTVPQLYTIAAGLIGGIRSIVYVLALMFLIFYMYSIIGFFLFRENDPFHFGTIWLGLITLWQVTTFEDWTDIMYVNYYGCGSDDYSQSDVYTRDYSESQAIGLSYCPPEQSTAFGWVSVLFFVSFVFISAFVMLSLFVGSVTISMTASMRILKEEKEEAYKKRVLERARSRAATMTGDRQGSSSKLSFGNSSRFGLRALSDVFGFRKSQVRLSQTSKSQISKSNLEPDFSSSQSDLKLATPRRTSSEDDESADSTSSFSMADFGGAGIARLRELFEVVLGDDAHVFAGKRVDPTEFYSPLKKLYVSISKQVEERIEDRRFEACMTFIIILASALVGLSTFQLSSSASAVMNVLEVLVNACFLMEVCLKMIARRYQPWEYIYDRGSFNSWNIFDIGIVILSLAPTNSTSSIGIIRLFRLLRIFKLLKTITELQVVVQALIKGIGSIQYIGAILFLTYYMFGILGMILFKENDPFHFGTLHISLFTLFRCATMEDWADVMYIEMYGCSMGGYASMYLEHLCVSPQPSGFLAAIYFFSFTLVGGFIMTTLFIGVVSTAMDETHTKLMEQQDIEEQSLLAKQELGVSDEVYHAMCEIFNLIDLDGGGSIDEDELAVGFLTVGNEFSKEQIKEMVAKVDEDGSGEIDLSEFVRFITIFQAETRQRGLEKQAEIIKKEQRMKMKAAMAFAHKETRAHVEHAAMEKHMENVNSPVEIDKGSLPGVHVATSGGQSCQRERPIDMLPAVLENLSDCDSAGGSSKMVVQNDATAQQVSTQHFLATQIARHTPHGGGPAVSPLGAEAPFSKQLAARVIEQPSRNVAGDQSPASLAVLKYPASLQAPTKDIVVTVEPVKQVPASLRAPNKDIVVVTNLEESSDDEEKDSSESDSSSDSNEDSGDSSSEASSGHNEERNEKMRKT